MLHAHRYTPLVLLIATTALACASTTYVPASAPGTNWTLLGQRTVNHRVDRDEIKVGVRDGDFRRIKLVVRNRAVTFRDVKVHYRNGGVQDIQLRKQIPAGGETRVIDLNGQDRIIDKVVFWYNTRPHRGERAVVQLFGRN